MCKIIISFGQPLTKEIMEDHRETVEQGCGIGYPLAGLREFGIAQSMTHEGLYEQLGSIPSAPFQLFHSRFRSAGAVDGSNVQPFVRGNYLLAHNGTADRKELAMAAVGRGVSFSHTDSDSRILAALIGTMPVADAVELLRLIDDNFVFADAENQKVYIIGKFAFEENKTGISIARNKWATPEIFLVTDFEGNVVEYVEYKEAPVTYYPARYGGYNQGDFYDADQPTIINGKNCYYDYDLRKYVPEDEYFGLAEGETLDVAAKKNKRKKRHTESHIGY